MLTHRVAELTDLSDGVVYYVDERTYMDEINDREEWREGWWKAAFDSAVQREIDRGCSCVMLYEPDYPQD